MGRILLIDDDPGHAARICGRLHTHSLQVEICSNAERAIPRLRRAGCEYEVVIVNVSSAREPWIRIVSKLQEASFQGGSYSWPLFLCVSTVERPAEFELRIERMGARYVFER